MAVAPSPLPVGRPRSARAGAQRRGLPALATLGQTAFWVVLVLIILAPCAAFLVLAVSPRLFDQGSSYLTLQPLAAVLTGQTAVAIGNSLWVSAAAAALGVAVGLPIAWLCARTDAPLRGPVTASMWLVLLLPSWLPSLGWVRLVQLDGVMYRLGMNLPFITHAILGPAGVVLVLGLRNVPFSFLAISAALAGLGQEFEDAARVHGASRLGALAVVGPIIAPAIWSAIAIGFAEAVSDFGVAATLAYQANFPLGTYQLYAAINNFPPSFPTAAAMSWLLVASVGIPLALQARALRGRSYAVLSGRSRQATRRHLGPAGRALTLAAFLVFALVALGVPAFGAVSGSLLGDYGGSFTLTTANYSAMLHSSSLTDPIVRSLQYGALTASVTVVLGYTAARFLTRAKGPATRLLDFLLLAAVAIPSVIFAAGYIMAYNLPLLSRLGINLYQTVGLLLVAYTASSLPTNARLLVGSVSQLQPSLHDAARVHGAGAIMAWLRGVAPLISRPLLYAWLLTFSAVFLELPISQLLYAPSQPPVSVAIEDNLSNYHFGVGTAQSVLAVALALGIVLCVLGAYRLLAPRGWLRIGGPRR
ncbi:MAG TPA: ABC transporter permease subunit [Solirubrobacteraceae bacterium]|nr:ABC transporter permease subunit [Solirubrobacteraceae bacterium]